MKALAILNALKHNKESGSLLSFIIIVKDWCDMNRWSSREVLFGLHEITGVGWRAIHAVQQVIGWEQLHHWVDRKSDEWQELGFKPSAASRLATGLTSDYINNKLELTYKSGTNWITMLDESYPDLLKETIEPPWVLYGKGEWRLLKQHAVAMVGTRHATVYGKKVAYRLSADLAARGLVVVSGLARGIDAAAHEGAMSTGSTIAVLGGSLQSIYPPEHTTLARRIAETGLIISEYSLDTAPRAGLFPRRNRIIAGLSLATVVVEAALRSGALITADHALDMSREVLAVPGPITSPKSEGPLKLLREGSKPAASAQDVIEEITCQLTTLQFSDNNGTVTFDDVTMNDVPLLADEQLVMEQLEGHRSTFDELLVVTGLPFAQLHSILLSLQLKKRIHEHAGGVYGSI